MKLIKKTAEKLQKIRERIVQKFVQLFMGSFFSPLHH